MNNLIKIFVVIFLIFPTILYSKDILKAKKHPTILRFLSKNPNILNDLNEIFELDFHNMKKSENVTNYDKKIMTRFMSELVKYHFPDVKSFKVAKDLFN